MLLGDALNEMEMRDPLSGEKRPFSLKYIQHDKSRGKSGAVISLSNVVKVGSPWDQNKNQMINVRAPGNSRHPYPVHIRLIIEYNGHPITW